MFVCSIITAISTSSRETKDIIISDSGRIPFGGIKN